MKKYWYAAFLALVVMSSAFVGSRWSQREAGQDRHVGMSPTDSAEKMLGVHTATDMETSSSPPGTVNISYEKQQALGVRVGSVEKKPMTHTLRVLGRVAADETRVYRLNAAIDGWILKTFDNSSGSLVRKDELLATFYSPEFLGGVQAYLFSLSAADRFQTSGRETAEQINLTKTGVEQNKNSLRNIGMTDLQLEEIARTHEYTEEIYIAAPVTGFVLARNISPGEKFDRGKELYRFADLSQVWILADIFENEAQLLQPAGKIVKVSLPNQRKTFTAKVSNVLPLFDGTSRTLKVRLEADNPGYFLRPDMFVDVELPIELPMAMSVPADAILDSGLRKTVYVEKGKGYFEPREVETGWHLGNRVEIIEGLAPGERIALSGTFLIDSESRMQLAAEGIYETLTKDPVSSENVSVKKAEKAGRKSKYKGKTYYFASEESKEQFEKDPEHYAENPADEGCLHEPTSPPKSSEKREPGA
jgi:membrane fusion protein, copper/silver efflux system